MKRNKKAKNGNYTQRLVLPVLLLSVLRDFDFLDNLPVSSQGETSYRYC